MRRPLGEFLDSKKGIALLVGIFLWISGRILQFDRMDLLPLIGLIAIFILAQGMNDVGKGAAKFKLDTTDENHLRIMLDRQIRSNRGTVDERGPRKEP